MKRKCLCTLGLIAGLSMLTACGQQTESVANIIETETAVASEPEEETETPMETETPIETETAIVEETLTETMEPVETVIETEVESIEQAELYTIEPMNTTMYATATCNIRNMPSTDGEIVGSVNYGGEVQITGKTTYNGKNWYQVAVNSTENEFISASLLSEAKPEVKDPVQTADSVTSQPLEDNSPASTGQVSNEPYNNTTNPAPGTSNTFTDPDTGATVTITNGGSDEEFENWTPGW